MESKKWYRSRMAFWLYILILSIPLAEVAARVAGHKPYDPLSFTIAAEPANCLIGDSELGIRLNPGNYKVTLNDQLSYNVTHNNDGHRSLGRKQDGKNKKLFLFGCSFTYGLGIDDSLTFASLLASQQNNYSIENFAAPGYGTVQSYLQLKQEIQNGNLPDRVILCFSYLHFDRNALSPSYRKALLNGYGNSAAGTNQLLKEARFPYLENDEIRYEKWEDVYQNWPFRKISAVANLMNNISDQRKTEKLDLIGTTQSIMNKLYALCQSHELPFHVVFLDRNKDTKELIDFCQLRDIPTLQVGWDYMDKQLTNMPVDNHPNKQGHQFIASKILPILTQNP